MSIVIRRAALDHEKGTLLHVSGTAALVGAAAHDQRDQQRPPAQVVTFARTTHAGHITRKGTGQSLLNCGLLGRARR